MNVYWRKRGVHVHMRVFHNGRLGDLCCGKNDFETIRRAMIGASFEEEAPPDTVSMTRPDVFGRRHRIAVVITDEINACCSAEEQRDLTEEVIKLAIGLYTIRFRDVPRAIRRMRCANCGTSRRM
ncbi:hypothetical protein I6F26_10470 [Ensifer sp. IC3342]|nr:hypothetical protein [Ensifer sp. BRP08]MCA1447003.1 hypothetical protein [Ensifer sp. IC3342]